METTLELTEEQTALVKDLRAQGMAYHRIAERLNVSLQIVHRILDPGYMARQRANWARERQREREANAGILRPDLNKAAEPPDYVLAERDCRMSLEPASLTAAILGDPLPGQSALDQRKA